MSDWYYAKDGQQEGPIHESDLKTLIVTNAIPPNSLVWKAGMENWKPANQTAEFQVSPPPMPAMAKVSSSIEKPKETKSEPEPPASDVPDEEENKVFAILSYIGVLFIVPLLAAKNSKFAMFHANQGIILFITLLAAVITASILSFILGFVPIVGWMLIASIQVAYSAGYFVLLAMGVIHAATGKKEPLPYIGKYQIIPEPKLTE